ncbi:hypothetical protein PR202_ga10679 [Eleusine coracana subsp. coracana]|uniref:Uncharacterized protein n=1 Tax=Eleusine coracana subsp. coracana TaxID=191504 RepID=A0AAV5C7F0_ELECO|nr:hypothetical protein PR202_ga10679 [Eleusine coracana subsp. coracana]
MTLRISFQCSLVLERLWLGLGWALVWAVVGVEALAFAFAGLGWAMVAGFVVWVGRIGLAVVWGELHENMGMMRKVDDGGCLDSGNWAERIVDMVAGAMDL